MLLHSVTIIKNSILCINFSTDAIEPSAAYTKPSCCRNLTKLFHKTTCEKYNDQNNMDYVRVSEH